MRRYMMSIIVSVTVALGLVHAMSAAPAFAATAAEIDQSVTAALRELYAKYPSAETLAQKAKGILVFPSIVKAGFIVGGLYGEGALREGSTTEGYYHTVAASYGLQVGIQKYGYALIFMTDSALNYLNKSDGWEIGIGPSIVIVDEGMARSLTTTTAKANIYAYFFNQKGLMAGMGLQGTKITKIEK